MAADGGQITLWRALLFGLLLTTVQSDNGKHHHKGKLCDSVPDKKIDNAWLTIDIEDVAVNLTLKRISSECYTCKLQPIVVFNVQENITRCTVLVDTRWKMRLGVTTDDDFTRLEGCGETSLGHWFTEGGNYTIVIGSSGPNKIMCQKPVLYNNPPDSNIPIYVAIGCFVAAAVLWVLLKRLLRSTFIYRVIYRLSPRSGSFLDPVSIPHDEKARKDAHVADRKSKTNQNLRRRKRPASPESNSETAYTAQDLGMPTTNGTGEAGGSPAQPQKERLKSLDTFRGISIVIMIFVNYRGGDYWFFKHSKWNGITVADIVFPWFVWIMGTAMAYSFQSLLRKATPKSLIFWKIVKRSIILFGLGLLINSSDGLNPVRMREFRIPGVLQRFAGTYLIVATLHLMFIKQNVPHQLGRWSIIQDVIIYWQEWIVNLILVFVWLMLTFFLPVPGCPKGYLGAGGLSNDAPDHHNVKDNVTYCTGGAASYIDRTIFGEGRIYQTPTCKEIYKTTVPHDPEGLLGTLTSCFMCFLGLQAGKILITFHDWKARTKRFIIWGIILGIIALILCEGKKDGGFIPINKNLWSLSFVICLSSFAFFLFTFCYLTIDVFKKWTGAPFYYPGMNAIVLYMGHEMINQPFKRFWGISPNSHAAYLGINIWDTTVWVLLAYFLHRHSIFISI